MAHSPGSLLDTDSWFHSGISRDEAEQVLISDGEEGSFLVRESSSSVGDYAVSVLSAGVVHHVQIQRHEGDAFFSIAGGPIIHGLDELIKYYQSPSSLGDDDILLQKAIIKSPPPPDGRRHGRTNLLHRATKEGSGEIVSGMVRTGHRCIDAKNEDGQTAAHIAAMLGLNPILTILINAGINVNAKDSASCTPLHYACINNLPDTVRILLQDGNANPQIRRNDNGWVPMHEAAFRGHLMCVAILREYYAPLRPRTLDHKLPIHLAIEENKVETIQFFDTVKSRKAISNRDDWYHGRLGRQEALKSLQLCQHASPEHDPSTSYFLIRRHSLKNDVYVLTLLFQGHTYNFEIGREANFFFIDDGPYLDSLEHVVDHYTRWQDGLPSSLHNPVGPTQTFSQPPAPSRSNSTTDVLQLPPPLPRRTAMSCSPNTLHRLCHDLENNNLEREREQQQRSLPPFSRERIPHELVELGESLGGGEYGEVFEGKLTMGNSGTVIDVAVKTLKNDEGQMNEWTMKEFLREAKVMMELEHEHIVKIIGITCEPKIFMVQELLALGSLQAFLLDHPDQVMPDRDLRKWAHEIAKGMVYLQRKRFVHRDLAARNILLSKDRVAKISDFGLSRALGGNSDYYTATHGGRWPIKWYAPESCSHGTFSHASDVWSFAVTLWELYSFGETPFGQETTGREVIEMVERGERLDKPKHCPDKIYSVMKKCWNMDPDLRPTFTFLENFFANPILAAMVPSSTESSTTPEQPSSSQQHVHDDNLMIDLNDNNDGGGVTYTNTIERPRPRPSVPGGTASTTPLNDLNRLSNSVSQNRSMPGFVKFCVRFSHILQL
ncbi:tyrosine-protein kinase Shark isoform X3 [Folsomia candida]|uniref:tyrosine-protein kinase Shark isoform X3 n=1 Tax=Folsomia candida TaxID=158441 RepID=UPI00160505E8|nr:tyrosine-protein kinase Shark isoform X3 [Folsomia candida]